MEGELAAAVSDEQRDGPTPPPDPRQGGKRHDVFISHAGLQEQNFAVWLQQRLEAAGFSAFLDEANLHDGVSGAALMEAVLRSSQVQCTACHMLPRGACMLGTMARHTQAPAVSLTFFS